MTIYNLATLPGYYYLYALYADYPINDDWFSPQEYEARVREALRAIQPTLSARQPMRKSMALRLFTEREALHRYSPEQVSEAWRQLRDLVDLLGPPPGWPHPPAHWSRYAPVWRQKREAWEAHQAERRQNQQLAAETDPAKKAPDAAPFPKSPVDYEQLA